MLQTNFAKGCEGSHDVGPLNGADPTSGGSSQGAMAPPLKSAI